MLFCMNFNAQIGKIKNAQVINTKGNSYYRVTAKGFICNRETVDDMLERDGKRDEIYLTSASVLINADGVSMPETSMKNRSRTFGDINGRAVEERRAMAGSADGNLGGIKTGDQLPDVNPWKNNVAAKGDLLPFILWEGELSGGKSVLITPSIMEWDGPADFLTAFWHESFMGRILHAPVAFGSIPFKMFTGTGINDPFNLGSYDDSTPGVFPPPTVIQQFQNFYKVNYEEFSSSDKQKYLQAISVDSGRPNDRPIGVSNGLYNPLNIKLDASTFSRIANTDFGYGKGIIPLKFKDESGANGDYTVFYSFEIVTNEAEKNRINVTNSDAFNLTTPYQFKNALSGRVMDLLNAGNVLVLNDDKNITPQKFYIKKTNNAFRFQNVFNNQYLELYSQNGKSIMGTNPNPTNSYYLIRYCDGSWIFKMTTDNIFNTISTENFGTNILTPVIFEKYVGAQNQRWFFEE